MARIADGLATRTFLLPWLARPPVGVTALTQLVTHPVSQPVTQPVPVHPAQSG
jgi:arsenite-transporting ATPase